VPNEIELTELTDIDVLRQDGVKSPASGWEFIIQKDVNAVGGIDEKPDIAGAESVLCLLYKLLESEAREGQVGAHEECDVNLLTEAISLIKWFKENEERGALCDDGEMCKSVDGLVFKAHRKFGSDERKSLAAEGKALPDGSYPIPDEDALRRAAILARSGHGDVAAAKRLIAKRARELGVPNPLADNKTEKDALEGATNETETKAPAEVSGGETLTKDSVAKMIEDAVAAKVGELAKERDEALAALDVLKATPIPAGVVLTAPQSARDSQDRDAAVAKAAYHRRQAELTQDREMQSYHRNKAKALDAAANA
jgi:hypothetical protein